MVNNHDWLGQLGYIELLQEVGTHFTINRMLTFDSVKLRLDREQPMTFLEFNYMILQGYDFRHLSKAMGVRLQLGGSDQWGNRRSEEHTSELQSLMRNSYADFCLKKNIKQTK